MFNILQILWCRIIGQCELFGLIIGQCELFGVGSLVNTNYLLSEHWSIWFHCCQIIGWHKFFVVESLASMNSLVFRSLSSIVSLSDHLSVSTNSLMSNHWPVQYFRVRSLASTNSLCSDHWPAWILWFSIIGQYGFFGIWSLTSMNTLGLDHWPVWFL